MLSFWLELSFVGEAGEVMGFVLSGNNEALFKKIKVFNASSVWAGVLWLPAQFYL